METTEFQDNHGRSQYLRPSDAYRQARPLQQPAEYHQKPPLEPNAETQKIYDNLKNKLLADKLKEHLAASSQYGRLGTASAGSRSTMDDIGYSPNTAHSPFFEYDDARSQNGRSPAELHTSNRVAKTTKSRGKRLGPLELETKFNANLVRKLKLACVDHKERKVKCDCHDFSLFEDAWERSRTQQPAQRSHQPPALQTPGPSHDAEFELPDAVPWLTLPIPDIEIVPFIEEGWGTEAPRTGIVEFLGHFDQMRISPPHPNAIALLDTTDSLFLQGASWTGQFQPATMEHKIDIASGFYMSSPGQLWACSCQMGIYNETAPNPDTCLYFASAMHTLYSHFHYEHWPGPVVDESYQLQCQNCLVCYPASNPPEFPDHLYCTCDPQEQGTTWILKFVLSRTESSSAELEAESVRNSISTAPYTMSSSSSYSVYDPHGNSGSYYDPNFVLDYSGGTGRYGFSELAASSGGQKRHKGHRDETNAATLKKPGLLGSSRDSTEPMILKVPQYCQPKMPRRRRFSSITRSWQQPPGSVADDLPSRSDRASVFRRNLRQLTLQATMILKAAALIIGPLLLLLVGIGVTRETFEPGWQQVIAN